MEKEITLCGGCHCMTKSIVKSRAKWICGKCGHDAKRDQEPFPPADAVVPIGRSEADDHQDQRHHRVDGKLEHDLGVRAAGGGELGVPDAKLGTRDQDQHHRERQGSARPAVGSGHDASQSQRPGHGRGHGNWLPDESGAQEYAPGDSREQAGETTT